MSTLEHNRDFKEESKDENDAPGDWVKIFSKSKGAYYWFNSKKGISQWTAPTEINITTKRELEDSKTVDSNSDFAFEGSTSKKLRKDDGGHYMPFVGIIVPFRDLHVEQNRAAHLKEFIPRMKRYSIFYWKLQLPIIFFMN